MPGRIPDYPDIFEGWEAVASYGSYLTVLGGFLFFYVVYKKLTTTHNYPPNPWETTKGISATL